MQDDVLKMNLRGHTAEDVFTASQLIKEYGFSLGLQMMPGLYGQKDYMEYAVDTAEKFISIRPDTVRIYPTLTLKDTLLESLYQKGMYTPLTIAQAVEICAVLVKMFNTEGIKIIKLGLHADTGLEESLVAGPYHPAMKELVYSHIMLENFVQDLQHRKKGRYIIYVNGRKHSQAAGQKKANLKSLAEMGYDVTIKDDNSLTGDNYTIIEEGEKQCI